MLNGTAENGQDYSDFETGTLPRSQDPTRDRLRGILKIDPYTKISRNNLEIMIPDDDIAEGNETFEVYIHRVEPSDNVLNNNPAANFVQITIRDNDGE